MQCTIFIDLILDIPFTRGTFSELGIRFIQSLVVEEVWRVEWEENCFQPKITLLYFTIRIPRALIIKTLSFFFMTDQKCHLAFFRPIFYDLAWSLFFLFFTWGWWESQTISLKCQNLLSSQMFNGAKLAVASVARATPLFLPRPEIIYINVLHYSAPDWRHCT